MSRAELLAGIRKRWEEVERRRSQLGSMEASQDLNSWLRVHLEEIVLDLQALEDMEALRECEGWGVTILCDDPEAWQRDRRCGVDACGEWTDWIERRFMAETIPQALTLARIELEQWKRIMEAPDRPLEVSPAPAPPQPRQGVPIEPFEGHIAGSEGWGIEDHDGELGVVVGFYAELREGETIEGAQARARAAQAKWRWRNGRLLAPIEDGEDT